MIVLLALYPAVFMIAARIDHPFFTGRLHLPHWAALFVDCVISVLALNLIVPWISRRLDWWLRPAGQSAKVTMAGVALLLGLYLLILIAVWQYEAHIWRPY